LHCAQKRPNPTMIPNNKWDQKRSLMIRWEYGVQSLPSRTFVCQSKSLFGSAWLLLQTFVTSHLTTIRGREVAWEEITTQENVAQGDGMWDLFLQPMAH
jgi:hypothetical protein